MPVIGVGCYVEGRGVCRDIVFVDAIKRTDEPVALCYTFARGAAVEGMGLKPDGVVHMVQYIHLAAGASVAERLENPVYLLSEVPGDGVPVTVGILKNPCIPGINPI